jgi:hypothetical protein
MTRQAYQSPPLSRAFARSPIPRVSQRFRRGHDHFPGKILRHREGGALFFRRVHVGFRVGGDSARVTAPS